MEKILIIGGLGFIGSHFVDYLKDKDLTIVDPAVIKFRYQHEICEQHRVVRAKIQDINGFFDKSFDLIVHCGNPVGILNILNYSHNLVSEIVMPTLSALKLSDFVIYFSSSDIYGKNGYLSETDTCNVEVSDYPRRSYQIGKIAAEQIVISSSPGSLIIRPFNIIGNRQLENLGFVVPRFIKSIINNQPVEIFYDGTQSRAFMDVQDLVEGTIHLLNTGKVGIFNIGNPQNLISITEMADLIALLMGKPNHPKTFINPEQKYKGFLEGYNKLPVIDKIQQTGWMPKISLQQSLRGIIKCYAM